MAMMNMGSAPARLGRYAGKSGKGKGKGKGKPGNAVAQPQVTVVLGAAPRGLINR